MTCHVRGLDPILINATDIDPIPIGSDENEDISVLVGIYALHIFLSRSEKKRQTLREHLSQVWKATDLACRISNNQKV